ncbi:pepsin/retropepsin-like aspartic protease family protein [Lysobacter soyae]|uniref:Aspartyl protease family protein n=1 Tax=Lysobacter soyae TaxID=2764185 RepID=A0ABX8WL94_9GAMM|nr:pepsin/retropepsin-like aspartic protease family protein [Lysobacter sp. CJ11]QYR52392.1 aspartyl protease family protein [Lysobacter sp. CJ11]
MNSCRRVLFTCIVCLASPFANAATAACDPLPAAPARFDVQVPFDVVDGRIYIDAQVNGQGPFRFAVDTGASDFGRADTSLVKRLGLKLDAQALNSDGLNTRAVDTTHLTSLRIGRLMRTNLQVITRDYSSKMKPEAALSGIIAREFFADGLLIIDYPNKRLSFSRSLSLRPDSPGSLPYTKPFRVPVRIGQVTVEGNLDTGANVAFVLPQTLFERVGGKDPVRAEAGTLANTKIDTARASLKGPFVLGRVQLENQEVRVSETYPELLVGAHALQHFKVLIDQRSKRVAVCAAAPGP